MYLLMTHHAGSLYSLAQTGSIGFAPELVAGELNNPEIIALAQQIAGNASGNTPSEKIALFDSWVEHNLTFDRESPARNQGALAGLRARSGVCEEYACLFVALCRASGIPAQVVYGFVAQRDMTMLYHAWAVVNDGDGWRYVDPFYPNRWWWPQTYVPAFYLGQGVFVKPWSAWQSLRWTGWWANFGYAVVR